MKKTLEEQAIVNDVKEDFKKRQHERRAFESQWQLNMNFLMGNQYCSVGLGGEIEDFDKQYFWQEREVFNHVAPLIEARLSKLQRVKPSMTVVPASGDERDMKTAKISKKIIHSVYNKLDISNIITEATKWSEVCGTSFYKCTWNDKGGDVIAKTDDGEKVYSGEININVVTPFEIFPDSSVSEGLHACQSLIHAKAYSVDEIKAIWGKEVTGEDINIFSLDHTSIGFGGLGYNSSANKIVDQVKKNCAIVIEKYIKPTLNHPNGQLIIIAGDELLFKGDLPYINAKDGVRDFPFIRQLSIEQVGCFWGASVIERIIPVQRAYNAIKNRKHEFLNRLSMGVLTVEDGSVDTDNLEEEGLCPGKILVYRQGSSAPRYLSAGSVPSDFTIEEQRLLNEFTEISGVSEIMRNANVNSNNVSGVALQILVEQDDTRLAITAENIRKCIKTMAQNILRLYKQFAVMPRLSKIVGDNGEIEMFYFNSSDISSDEVVFETENEIGETLAQRRSMVFDLLNAGLLHDENGKLSNRMRIKALELLGFGVWENAQDLNELQSKHAASENLKLLKKQKCDVLEIDDHELHVNEHIAFMLSGEYEKVYEKDASIQERFLKHIRMHREFAALTNVNKNMEE